MSSAEKNRKEQAGTVVAPYIGLRPFREDESERFFARDREISILLDKIRANRLTLLLAGSGVGKSSLLRAGIMPILDQDEDAELIYHRHWATDPGAALRQSISEHFQEKYKGASLVEQFARLSLKDSLRACRIFSSGQQVLLLDQFEEFFNYQRFQKGFQPFIEELSAAVLDRGLAASFVFSMREDFALELNSFKKTLPGVFDNYFRLEKLTREQARMAIEEPLKGTGYSFAPPTEGQEGLLEQVLENLAKREQERHFGVQEMINLKELPLLVEPPHLQIVCQELWERHRDDGKKQLTSAAYEKAGKTAGILNSYFLRKIELFSKKEQVLASAAFDHLVGTRAVKIAHPLGRLAELARADGKELELVLDRLQDYAILRRQKRGEEFWYELYHDIFSESIDSWNREFKARQRVKRLVCGAVAALFAGCILFAGNNWRANYYGRYLQLSYKAGVSDRIEVYQGTAGGLDVFHQRDFLYESSFVRRQIEADRRFDRGTVEDKANTLVNLVGRLPLLDRLSSYAENGLYSKIDTIVIFFDESNETKLIDSLPAQLASVRTEHSVNLLSYIAEKQMDINAATGIAQLGDKSALIKLLDNEKTEVRKNAAKALGGLGDSSIVPVLVKLLEDRSVYVRMSAVEALGKLGDTSAASILVELIENSDSSQQRNMVGILSRLGDTSVVPALVKLLKSKDSSVKSNAAEILGRLGDTSAVPVLAVSALIKVLKDRNPYVRRSAAEALGKLGDTSAASVLVKLLEDENPKVQRNAAEALGRLGDTSAASILVKLLEDEDSYMRENAAKALGRLGDSSAVPALVKLLEDENSDARRNAAEALGKLGNASAAQALIKLLEDGNFYVRRNATEALGRLGDPSVAPTLVKLLKDRDSYVRGNAAEALGRLGNISDASGLTRLLEDENSYVRRNAAEALGKLGDTSAASVLIKFIDYKDNSKVYQESKIRGRAAKALGKLGDISAVSSLTKLLNYGYDADAHDLDVRGSAAEALGRLGDPSVAPALVKLLADDYVYPVYYPELEVDPSLYIQRKAVETLGRLKVEAAGQILSRYLKNTALRDVAAKALLRMNHSSPELLEWQKDQLKKVRKRQPVTNEQKQETAATFGFVFTEYSVSLLSNLLKDTDQNVVKAAVESIGSIGEYHPDLVRAPVESLLKLTEHTNLELQQSTITALGQLISFQGKETPAELLKLEQKVHTVLRNILFDQKEKKVIRQTALDALGTTGRQDYAEEFYELLSSLEEGKDDSLRYRCVLWLGRIIHSPTYDYIKNELKELEKEKATWRKERDNEEQRSVSNDLEKKDKKWRKEHWEYMLGNALARIKPEITGIKLLNHPLYQVRQGAIRALASRIADRAADASLIGKIIQAHQNFDPDDLPSPFPYAAFQAIDLALWNLEYSGKKDDVTKLKEILNNLKPCQVPGQEGAIKERLEWTIERLEENLARNAEKVDVD
jgi:HEAT repeat protein